MQLFIPLCQVIKNKYICTTTIRSLSNIVLPQKVSKLRNVPDNIKKPTYVKDYSKYEIENKTKYNAPLTQENVEKFKLTCRLARKILEEVGVLVKAGVSTDQLDEFAHQLCIDQNCYPAPLLYKGFPKSICTSINNVVCHGIPDDRLLCVGDVLNIDVTIFKDGFYGDTSHTFIVQENTFNKNNINNIYNKNNINKENEKNQHIVKIAEMCRDEAIRICKPGQKFNAIGKIISEIAIENKLRVLPEICGHGISTYFHGPPVIYHAENSMEGTMRDGMSFTIEPVICEGSGDLEMCEDGWTIVTADGGYSAQFEHTILVTKHAAEVLTR